MLMDKTLQVRCFSPFIASFKFLVFAQRSIPGVSGHKGNHRVLYFLINVLENPRSENGYLNHDACLTVQGTFNKARVAHS